jgi:hypothetical protein
MYYMWKGQQHRFATGALKKNEDETPSGEDKKHNDNNNNNTTSSTASTGEEISHQLDLTKLTNAQAQLFSLLTRHVKAKYVFLVPFCSLPG